MSFVRSLYRLGTFTANWSRRRSESAFRVCCSRYLLAKILKHFHTTMMKVPSVFFNFWALVLIIVADSPGRLIGQILPAPPTPDSNANLPYYDDEGNLIGTVIPDPSTKKKVPVSHYDAHGRLIGVIYLESNPLLRVSGPTSPVRLDQPRPAETATTSKQSQVNTPLPAQNNSAHPPRAQPPPAVDSSWDGWPNGSFVLFLTPQQIRNTNSLAVQWSSEAFGHQSKGTHLSETWQRSRVTQRRCLGAIQCFNTVCGVCSPPAIRGIHIAQQLEERCLCGAILEHRQCTVHWTVHIYSQGARFENFGEHSHSRFSHTLPVLAKERPQFFAFENKPVVSLSGDEVLVDLNATSRVRFDVSSSSMEYSDRDESILDDGSDEVTRTSLGGDSTITSPNDPEVAEDPSIVDSDQNLHSEEALANFLVDDTSPEPLFFSEILCFSEK
ncbi:hypothetical protein B0H14DRAFT_480045 [Mycena olivaceomarginata]|nr:hypothetical protein B0H14DRAFT_480045 [Mycena olivaceomarginata]